MKENYYSGHIVVITRDAEYLQIRFRQFAKSPVCKYLKRMEHENTFKEIQSKEFDDAFFSSNGFLSELNKKDLQEIKTKYNIR